MVREESFLKARSISYSQNWKGTSSNGAKHSGNIVLKATSPGLVSSEVALKAE